MATLDRLVVRPARFGDSEAICAIYNAAVAERSSTFETEPSTAEEFRERMAQERFPFLVAEKGGLVIAWAALSRYSARSWYDDVAEFSIYVDPGARGHGVGTALTEALAALAEQRSFYKLLGKLFTDNVASIRLVERCGFTAVGVHRRHGRLDGEWREVLLVERLLGSALDAPPAGRAAS